MNFDSFFIKTSDKKIEDFSALLASDYRVEIARWFSEGWATFKGLAAGSVAYAVLAAVCYGAINMLAAGAGLALQYPLLAGFIVAGLMHRSGEHPELKHYFFGFRYLLPLLAFTVVSLVLVVLGLLLLLIPGLYLLIAYQFAPFLIVDKKLDFWPAMELSRKRVNRHFFGVLVLSMALFSLNLACVITFGLGLFLTLPLTMFIQCAAYRDMFAHDKNCIQALPSQ